MVHFTTWCDRDEMKKLILIIMPEYTIGGAKVQLRYIIDRL